ncbi:MAG: hypothetical protein QM305_08740 [Bacteroidota bacterium]|jgi:hypothetical protein|nr:hypothetical protein [Bacteroidota bacterium]
MMKVLKQTTRAGILLLLMLLPVKEFAQVAPFTADSIPVVNGEVVFTVDYEQDLTKHEFHKRAFHYLNSGLNPYSGGFLASNNDSTVTVVTDYLVMSKNVLSVFAMYMTYHLTLYYMDGKCQLTISNITFMEKGYFETLEQSTRELNMPEYSGKAIFVDKEYSTLTVRRASEKITEAALERINEVIQSIGHSFSKEVNV